MPRLFASTSMPVRILRRIGLLLLALLAAALLATLSLRLVTRFRYRIPDKAGIDEGTYVPLGGQEQYLHIRGRNTQNPVIIWLHGGPAGPDGYANYVFTQHLIEDYTVICWDQRGCGRTYYRNRAADPDNTTATFTQALIDLDALVDHACDRFACEQIILVGHSYGSLLGSQYALAHPEKVAAYIGVGQYVTHESDIYSYTDALARATAAGDDTAAMQAAYAAFTAERSLPNMIALRKQVQPYHRAPREANTIPIGIASPYMGVDDLRWFLRQMGDLEAYLALNDALFTHIMAVDLRTAPTDYAMPVGFISGGEDWTTPVNYARDYCDAISAPMKQLLTLDGCGHAPQYDAPAEFAAALLQMLDDFTAQQQSRRIG